MNPPLDWMLTVNKAAGHVSTVVRTAVGFVAPQPAGSSVELFTSYLKIKLVLYWAANVFFCSREKWADPFPVTMGGLCSFSLGINRPLRT